MPEKASKSDIPGLGYRLSADRPISECFAQVLEPNRKYDVLAPVADARGIVPVRSGCLVLGRTTGTDRAGKTDLYQFLHAHARIPFGWRDCTCARSPSKISGAFNREQIVPLRDWGHDRQSGLFSWLVATA